MGIKVRISIGRLWQSPREGSGLGHSFGEVMAAGTEVVGADETRRENISDEKRKGSGTET